MPLKPVVFVPGYPASELKQKSKSRTIFPPSLSVLQDKDRKKELIRLLSGPDDPPGDIVAGEPIRGVLGVAKQAQSLYDVLRSYGYTTQDGSLLAPIGWDWRKAVDDAMVQADLAGSIEHLAQQHARKVVVIIHSTGGLVLRALLEARPQLATKIEQILAFGVPWAGTLKAVRFLGVGEAFGLILFGKKLIGLSAAEVRNVMSRCQAAYDLFPPDPSKTDMRGADGKNLNLFVKAGPNNTSQGQIGPLVETSWIPAGPAKDYMREMAAKADQRLGQRTSAIELTGVPTPPITNVVGWGAATETLCRLTADGTLDFQPTTKDGDGTVAMVSAAWLRGPGVRTFFLPIGLFADFIIPEQHPRIWDPPATREIFNQVLKDTEPMPFVCGAIDGDQAVDRTGPFTVRLTASAADGQPLHNVKATFTTFPGHPTVAFTQDTVRREIVMNRGGLTPNAGQDLFRFRADISWGNGGPEERREVPLLVHV
jgi:pimeloyl-ACP methyl ester carboxylesterase